MTTPELLPEPRTYRIGYVSPESGYRLMRPEIIAVTTWDDLDALLDRVGQMNAGDGLRFGVTYGAYRQR